MKFTSPSEEAKAQVAALKAKGADVIIAVSHMGIDNEKQYP